MPTTTWLPRARKCLDHGLEVPHGLGQRQPVDDVVSADDDDRDVRRDVVGEAVELVGELPGLRSDLGSTDQAHRPVGRLGDALGQLDSERAAAALGPQPGSDRVAEHEQGQRLPSGALVGTVHQEALLTVRLADRGTGDTGLGDQQPPSTEHARAHRRGDSGGSGRGQHGTPLTGHATRRWTGGLATRPTSAA